MGCGNCGSGASGKPNGCKGNGGCSTGGCNRLNVFDWLNTLPLHDGAKPYPIVELSFSKGSRKEFFRNNTNYIFEKGDWVTVEGTSGVDVGQISLTGELVKLQLKKYSVKEQDVAKRVLHPSTDEELEISAKNKEREPETLIRSRAIARSLNLDMKICEVELQADGKKGTFFYTADQRVDFRELIRVFANDFKLKVEMRQIGARQESGKVGGIGSCGRELCCSTWLTEFKSVNTTAARYQNLSINQTKLSGQCGRLKCCLNFELDTYMDALSVFPDHAEHLETATGVAHLQKKDIFKNLMWYSYSGNNKQYPLTIERVREIVAMNKAGKKAEELAPVELETRGARGSIKTVDMGFVNDVGQITLKALEKKGGNNNKKKKKPSGKAEGQPQQQARPAQAQPAKQEGGQPKPKQEPRPNQPQKQNNNKPQQARPQQQNADGGGAQKPNQQPRQQGQGGGPKPQQQARPQQPRPEGGGDNKPAQEGGQQYKPRPQQQPKREGQPEGQGPKQGGEDRRQQRPQNNGGGNAARPPRPERPQTPKGEQPNAPQKPQGGATPPASEG